MKPISVDDLIEEAEAHGREEAEMNQEFEHEGGRWAVWELAGQIGKPRIVMTGTESECANYCSKAPLEYEGATYHKMAALPIICTGEVPEWK